MFQQQFHLSIEHRRAVHTGVVVEDAKHIEGIGRPDLSGSRVDLDGDAEDRRGDDVGGGEGDTSK